VRPTCAVFPGARYVEIPGGGHHLPVQRIEKLLEAPLPLVASAKGNR